MIILSNRASYWSFFILSYGSLQCLCGVATFIASLSVEEHIEIVGLFLFISPLGLIYLQHRSVFLRGVSVAV